MNEFKLTPAQLDFCTEKEGKETAMWNQGVVVSFDRKPTVQELNGAMNGLVETHENLRMRIVQRDKDVWSYIEEFQQEEYPVFSFLSRQELMSSAQEYINVPIDLSGQLFRCAIFETPQESGFIICAHHIVVDGFSTQIMASFFENYLSTGMPNESKTQSYAEFIEQEQKYRQSVRYERDWQYWSEQFEVQPVCTVLPGSAVSVKCMAEEVTNDVRDEVVEKIKEFCKDNKVSVASFFCTVIGSCICREYGHKVFTLGIPVLNRTTSAELNTIALRMHILPMIVGITSEPFRVCAQRTENAKMNLFRHQKFTQHEIKHLLAQRGIPTLQLFDVVFDYQSFPKCGDCGLFFQYSNTLSVPLEIHLHSYGTREHKLILRYRTELFSADEAREMCRNILAAAEYAVECPDVAATGIPRYRLTEQERDEVVTQLNRTEFCYPYSDNETIYSLFEATARATPDKCCIKYKDEHITFAQLRNCAERIDCMLRQVTSGKKGIVAILAERSTELYAAIYGTIRGGNAYLPIPPDYPKDRIDYMISNSSAVAVLAQRKFLPLVENVPCITLDGIFVPEEKAYVVSPCAAQANDTAYVIYTSGSTGRPKGVKISHRSVLNRILWMQFSYPMKSDSVILQKTPYSFDVSVWELFWWGMCGGSLAVSAPNEHFLPAKILQAVEVYEVTHLHFVPSVFDIFLTYMEKRPELRSRFKSVKHVFLSGEVLTASLVRRFYQLFTDFDVSLHNLYGPTECAVDVTSYDCESGEKDPVPIGRPIFNTQIYILDRNMQPLPKGIKGELCIGGKNVGQGYLNNAVLTSEKFVLNPFGAGRLYKTGDLAYIREDGQIIFCGRMDGQIKLNGQRVELGEIEAVIRNVKEVKEAAVVMRKVREKNLLVAYYCGEYNCEERIRGRCAEKLPSHMVPAVICRIDSMPLNRSGKLDRQSLMQMELVECEKNDDVVLGNEQEEYICGLFSQILGGVAVDRDSNFFELGGSSIDVIELLSDEKLQDIPVAAFFENPTPAGVAEKLRNNVRSEKSYIKCLRKAKNGNTSIVLFPYAGGSAEIFTKLMYAADNISWYYLDYPHGFDECQKIADEIEALDEREDLYFYAHCAGSAIALQIIRILESRKKMIVKCCIVGGSIPPAHPRTGNFWNTVPDDVLEMVLRKAGADLDAYSAEQTSEMLRRFRLDTDFMTMVFAQNAEKVVCSIWPIVSEKDIFTENCDQARMLWENYSENVSDALLIDSASHYFQTERADVLMGLILEIIKISRTA